MSPTWATALAAVAFTGLLVVMPVRGTIRSRTGEVGRATVWSTWGAVPVAAAGLGAVLLMTPDTVTAWTAACFGLYVAWATGQVVSVSRSRTMRRAAPRFVDLVLVSAACATITLFPLIADR